MKFKHICLSLILAGFLPIFAFGQELNLQKLIGDAIAKGQARVEIPPGTYRIVPADKKGQSHLSFKDVRDLEIDGKGATLILTDPEKSAMVFDRVDGLTLRGFTIDYDPLPFTQGTITAIGANPPSYDVKLDAGYPADAEYFSSRIAAYIFEPTGRQYKPSAFDHYVSKVTQKAPGIFHLEFENGDVVGRSGTSEGDRMVISRRAATAIAFFHCQRVTVDDVTILTAPGMAFHEAHGEGKNRYQFTMTYGPKPAGATQERLHTATADGVHSSYMHVGPTIENCHIEGHGDDAIAIHDNYSLVMNAGVGDQVVLAPKYELPLKTGDEVRFLDQQAYGLKAKALVKNIEKLPAPKGDDEKLLAEMWQKYRSDVAGKSIYRVTLDQTVDLKTGDLASSFDRTGAHFVVRNNVIGPHRARGILIKSPFGIVENNTIDGSSYCGILLGPELTTWLGGDYAAGVVVRNNVIRNVGYCANVAKGSSSALIGAISVQAKTIRNTLAENYENAGIVIEGNRIERPAAGGIFISSAKDVTVRNNIIENAWSYEGATTGRQYGAARGMAIYVNQARDVTVAGNKISPGGVNSIVVGSATVNIKIDE